MFCNATAYVYKHSIKFKCPLQCEWNIFASYSHRVYIFHSHLNNDSRCWMSVSSRWTDGMQWNATTTLNMSHSREDALIVANYWFKSIFYFRFSLFYFHEILSFSLSIHPFNIKWCSLCSHISFHFSKPFHCNPLILCVHVYLFATIKTRWMCIFFSALYLSKRKTVVSSACLFLLLFFADLEHQVEKQKEWENIKINIKPIFMAGIFGFVL